MTLILALEENKEIVGDTNKYLREICKKVEKKKDKKE